VIVGKTIECIYENNVLKPVGRVPFREGERIRIPVERKLRFEPIRLRKKPTSKEIRYLRTKITAPEEFVLKITETD
jgi:predicted DNA-binding antitoxin AbrB/MazE fold protein